MDQQSDEEIYRVRSQAKEFPCSWSLGPGIVTPGSDLVPQPEGSLNPLLLGFYESLIT